MNRKAIVNAVKAIILEKAKPERIWLYGSEASGLAKETSDIDIAYLDTEGKILERVQVLDAIRAEVGELPTLVKVDVSNIATAEERFSERVKTTGKVIYSASKKLRAEDALYNYAKALSRLEDADAQQEQIKKLQLDDIYLDLAVKRFEFTFEMSWKAIKRVLSMLGLEDAKSPRACFKEAYAQGFIKDQDIWLDMIEMRNLSAHTYDESEMQQIEQKLSGYIQAHRDLFSALEREVK